jgi:hypothetical protein
MARSTVHPHPFNKFVFVTVLAIDLENVDLRLVAGSRDPPSKTIPPERRTGLVPIADQERLLAAFNGGFQAKHGGHGMMVDGDIFLPAIDKACTVVIRKDGKVAIGTWSDLKGMEADAIAWRQSPPCLVEKAEVNPIARAGDGSRKFGMAIDGKMTIRRTALGVDATGRSLLFAFGEEVTPGLLAEALRASGAVSAAQFDVNWSYTKFFFYAHAQGKAPLVSASLVPKMKFAKGAYVTEASGRDFFYLKRKAQ